MLGRGPAMKWSREYRSQYLLLARRPTAYSHSDENSSTLGHDCALTKLSEKVHMRNSIYNYVVD